MTKYAALLLSVATTAIACGSSSGSPATNADSNTANLPDNHDAGTPVSPPGDAGSGGDTSTPPKPIVPVVACLDTPADVYGTPAGLPAMTMADRGTIVRCAKDGPLSASDIAAKFTAAAVTGVVATTTTTIYRIAYRTYRDDGIAGVSTARVYLPSAPRSTPLPVIAVAHPTVGLADVCVPSNDPTQLNDLALPWAARGFAVVATDYAGLGNEGVQGYTANHDQAHSLLDSARALRAMLDPTVFDNRVLLTGYSQGGGAVLASQGLAATYGAGGDIVAAIVYAPEYFSRLDSFGYVSMLRSPTDLTISTGISKPVVAASRNYAFGYNVLGVPNENATFPASSRTDTEQEITTLCQTPFGGWIQGVDPIIGDIFDDTFRTSFLACVDGTAGCTGVGSQLFAWMQADLVPPDPQGAPVLYFQGLADYIMPADEEAGCNIPLLKAGGVSVQTCIDPPAQHQDVVPRNVAAAVAWGEAKLDGKTLPTCSSDGLPSCSP